MLSRPQTAPSHKQRKAVEVRPLGRMPMPAKLHSAVGSSNDAAAIAALKGEILVVQRRVDELNGQQQQSAESAALEKHLLRFNVVPGDEIASLEVKNTLMELLIDRIRAASIAVLTKCGEDNLTLPPARPSGFLYLVDFADGIAQRQRLWEEEVERDATNRRDAGTQPDDAHRSAFASALDLALNEPTVAEVRRLRDQQKLLQAQIQILVDEKKRAATPLQPAVTEPKSPAPRVTPDHALHKQLEESKKQNVTLAKKIHELEQEVKKLKEGTENAEDKEEEREIARRVGAVAFGPLRERLMLAGVPADRLASLQEPDAAALAQRIAATATEGLALASDTKGKKKEGGGAVQLTDNVLWTTLFQQNTVVEQLIGFVEAAKEKAKRAEAAAAEEAKRTKRVSLTMEQRIQSLKATQARKELEYAAKLNEVQKESSKWKNLYQELVNKAPVKHRMVNVRDQPATADEREKALREELGYRLQCISDLTEQLNALQVQCEKEQTNSAVVSRESVSLLQRITAEMEKNAALQKELDERSAEVHNLKGSTLLLKREIKEKTNAEAEVQQQVWKLEVELHIAQNVITELRRREDMLNKAADEAQQCQGALRSELEGERDAFTQLQSEMKRQVQEAKTEQTVASDVLRRERSRMIENEKEVERLKSLDLQMEVLEHNFTNYAASKLAQRETQEEEERVLQGTVDSLLQGDVFMLPSGKESEDYLKLYLRQLQAEKVNYDNAERVRRRAKATSVNFKDDRSSKKQLLQLLQARLNEVQIFACEQRLRQIELERENRARKIELADSTKAGEASYHDWASSKLQCDALVQRNTELEMERKQLLRSRTSAELEIKNLKATIQRMRVSSEEQEKILVEVGTRLQGFRMASEPVDQPIGTVVAENVE